MPQTIRKLSYLERRFIKAPALKEVYEEFLNEYLQ